MNDRQLGDLLSAVGGALSADRSGDRARRVGAVEEAILAGLSGLPSQEARAALDALEERFPVRRSAAEERCAALERELEAQKARTAQLEGAVRALEDRLKSGASDEVRLMLERMMGEKPGGKPRPGLDDPRKLAAVVEVLAESAQKTIGYGNVSLQRLEFRDARFPALEELLQGLVDRPPAALAEGLRKELSRVRELLKAMIRAPLEFTPKWCENAQARFSQERFDQGSKARAWEKYVEFIQGYSFNADLMQGLRTFIDGERQRPQ